jgi:hypothetical protein
MTPSGRLAAAIEIAAEIDARRRPAADTLKDWGISHRFAGSGDRAAIAGLVYDALRRKASSAWIMGEDTARAVLIGMLKVERGLDAQAIGRLVSGAQYAPAPLTAHEHARLAAATLDDAPPSVVGDYPEWLDPLLAASFGEERAAEAAALALAAAMENHGQIYATDRDKRRLAPIHARLERSGVRNVQIRTPRGETDAVADLAGRADLVLIDAPCSGTGAWRRNPDAKWRIRPGALEQRSREQVEALDHAAALVKPGGRIAYVTCSVLEAENGAQVRAFLARHSGFEVVPPAQVMQALGERSFLFSRAVLASPEGLLMTPRRTDTDGFFVAVLHKAS